MVRVIRQLPDTANGKPPLLFVHGAWHGAWCWNEHFFDYFANRGYECHALDLRGHGDDHENGPMLRHGITEYIEDVAEAARDLREPPILVGHSMGGFVVQHYLQRHPAAAAVLAATVPWYGVWKIALRIAFNKPGAFLRSNLNLSLKPLIENREVAVGMMFSDSLEKETAYKYANLLGDESYWAFLQMLLLMPQRKQEVSCPVLVLVAGEDRLILPGEQMATATRYDIPLVTIDGLAHDIMLDTKWAEAAAAMAIWLDGLKL